MSICYCVITLEIIPQIILKFTCQLIVSCNYLHTAVVYCILGRKVLHAGQKAFKSNITINLNSSLDTYCRWKMFKFKLGDSLHSLVELVILLLTCCHWNSTLRVDYFKLSHTQVHCFHKIKGYTLLDDYNSILTGIQAHVGYYL